MFLEESLAVNAAYVPLSINIAMPVVTTGTRVQTFRHGHTHYVSLFKRKDYAASSGSLTYVTHGSLVATYQYSHDGGKQSAILSFVTNSVGGTTTTSTTSNATAGLAAYFSGPRLARIVFPATTLSSGEWMIAQAHSSSTAATSGTATTVFFASILHQAGPGNSGFQHFGSTNATSAHIGPGYPFVRGVASAITSNADMNSTVVSVGTINDFYIVFANT
jgi:hypothetical protein